MKKFVFRRILPVILAFSVTTSILVVPARAFTVTEAISVVQALLSTAESIERFRKEVVEHFQKVTTLTHGYGWCTADAGIAAWKVSEQELYELKDMVNNAGTKVTAKVSTHPINSDL